MCKRGDIYYVDFGEKDGSKQGGVRPALVVSNNKANKHSPVVTVVPLSARVWKKKYLPTHVQIPKGSGLNKPSMALAEQVEAPVSAGQELGTLTLTDAAGETVQSIPIRAAQSVERLTFGTMLRRMLSAAFFAG